MSNSTHLLEQELTGAVDAVVERAGLHAAYDRVVARRTSARLPEFVENTVNISFLSGQRFPEVALRPGCVRGTTFRLGPKSIIVPLLNSNVVSLVPLLVSTRLPTLLSSPMYSM
jgi:hypothetical protein